jgi:hypothetical protein
MEEIEDMKEDPEGWAVEVEEEEEYRPKQLDEDGNEKSRDFASPRKDR